MAAVRRSSACALGPGSVTADLASCAEQASKRIQQWPQGSVHAAAYEVVGLSMVSCTFSPSVRLTAESL